MDAGRSIGGLAVDGSMRSVERVKLLEERLNAEGMPESLVREFVRQEWLRIGLKVMDESNSTK